jgi:hypothetical protein
MKTSVMCATLVIALVASPSPEAAAGCPSAAGCDMAKDVQAVLDPDESCIDVRTEDDSCQCTSWVSLENNCSVNLQAEDFDFGFCRIDDVPMQEGCPSVIPPGSWGAIDLPLNPDAAPGAYEETVHLSVSGRAIVLRLTYEVVRVDSGCSCGTGGATGAMAALAGLFLLVSFLARRPGCR